MCLSAHPDVMVASCPNVELFRSFRNALVRNQGDVELKRSLAPAAPLQDYYGTEQRTRLLDLALNGNLDVPFDQEEWLNFHKVSVARGDLDCADLTPSYHRLKGKNYGEVIRNLLNIIAEVRNCGDKLWVGFHEVWSLDAYPALARAFPDARFLIMFRDPRATVHSLLGVTRIDPLQVAQVVSFVRHWRKYAALAHRFSSMPLFKGRLHITSHEQLVTQPRQTIEAMCRAFDLEFDERMLDTNNYFDFATGKTWSGNSSFEDTTSGISAHRARRWREKLDQVIVHAIEYLSGPDLKLVGYPSFTPFADVRNPIDGDVTSFLLRDLSGYANWRSDLEDPLLDLGLEAVRRHLLCLPEPSTNTALVRRTFLFEETYAAMRESPAPLLPALAQAL